MRVTTSRESRSLVRGRRLLVVSKLKKRSASPSKLVQPKPIFLENKELDRSFKVCAYPSAIEIFKLSEKLELSPFVIKSEFRKRRQAFRERNNLDEDTIIYSHVLPRIFAVLVAVLCIYSKSTQKTLLQAIALISSVFSAWYSAYKQQGISVNSCFFSTKRGHFSS